MILSRLSEKVAVEEEMELDELAAKLQSVFGRSTAIRVDESAYDLSLPPFVFDSETATVEELLFKRFQKFGVDFCFEAQGIVLARSTKTWLLAEQREYAPEDFGMTSRELRIRLAESVAMPDEWADVGGIAKMVTDPESGNVIVLHRQSAHLMFEHALDVFRVRK